MHSCDYSLLCVLDTLFNLSVLIILLTSGCINSSHPTGEKQVLSERVNLSHSAPHWHRAKLEPK